MFRANDVIQFDGKAYELISFLGNGGMGQVFLIEEQNTNNQFAMKTLTNFLPNDENYRSLINEWEKAQKIDHENVIHYLGFNNIDDTNHAPYIIMDLANGGTLQDFLDKQTEFLEEQYCLQIFHQIVDGMEAINSVLIHRDIKPDNIFINNGILKIADFGLAKVVQERTRSRTFKGWGTAPYTAPEAFRSEKNTIQMDMYSIGHVFFQIAGLSHAFGTQIDWEKAHLTMIAPALNSINSNVSPKVASVVNKLIEKRPKDRYQSWNEVREDLQSAAGNTGTYKDSVNKLLDKKLLKDLKLKNSKSDNILKDEELLRKKSIVKYQFEKALQSPLEELLFQLNETATSSDFAELNSNSANEMHEIDFSFNGEKVNIWFSVIDQSDELSIGLLEKLGVKIYPDISKPLTPKFRNKMILAWGAVNFSDKKGFNLLLVESEDDEYGNWHILKNSNLISTPDNSRAEPFALDRSELRYYIYFIDENYKYETDVEVIERGSLVELIIDHF